MNETLTTDFWIFEPNLNATLLILSKIAAYDFDDYDFDAISYGLTSTSVEKNIWFDYQLQGHRKLTLLLARDEDNTDIIFFQVLHNKDLSNEIALCIFTVQEFFMQNRH